MGLKNWSSKPSIEGLGKKNATYKRSKTIVYFDKSPVLLLLNKPFATP